MSPNQIGIDDDHIGMFRLPILERDSSSYARGVVND